MNTDKIVLDMRLLVGEECESALTEGAIRHRPRWTEENYEKLLQTVIGFGTSLTRSRNGRLLDRDILLDYFLTVVYFRITLHV
jgi:hypothetical protein